MKKIIFILILFNTLNSFSQNRNSVWCFGDSALIDFSDTSNIIVGSCGLDTRGSCASISNQTGELLFYAFTRAAMGGNTTLVFDSTHQVMQNGDNIIGRGWYNELVIIPNPSDDSTYYLFSIGVTSIFGLYYSIINMRLNNGLGAVVLKNQQLNTFEQVDCLTAIKHGNGRDWWIISRKSDFSTGGYNNDWYTYLVTPDTIQAMPTQSIGAQNRTNSGRTCFSKTGNKLVFTNLLNVVEVFDFDRCSGLLSNTLSIESDPGSSPYPFNWSCAFSSDGSKLYISTNDTLSFLYQYDLNASNITASKDTLWSTNFPKYTGGALKLAPDNKIYLSNIYYNGLQFPYPYPDSIYNMYNMNLSVINQPDSLGAASGFQPYSFYLGGKRTYVGLPNNPDYELGSLPGSACDTIVGLPVIHGRGELEIIMHPNPSSNKLFFTPIPPINTVIKIFDSTGRTIISKPFRQEIDISFIEEGFYLVKIFSNNEVLFNKTLIKIK